MGKFGITWPVMLLDDEWDDVSDLEEALRRIESQRDVVVVGEQGEKGPDEHFSSESNFPVYVSSPQEAIDNMINLVERGRRYSCIISDNHLKDVDDPEGVVDGDDFLRIITGGVQYCFSSEVDPGYGLSDFSNFREMSTIGDIRNDGALDFLESNFEGITHYVEFVRYWFGGRVVAPQLVMLCGAPEEAKLQGIESAVAVVQKSSVRPSGMDGVTYYPCEREIISHLTDNGVIPDDAVQRALSDPGAYVLRQILQPETCQE